MIAFEMDKIYHLRIEMRHFLSELNKHVNTFDYLTENIQNDIYIDGYQPDGLSEIAYQEACLIACGDAENLIQKLFEIKDVALRRVRSRQWRQSQYPNETADFKDPKNEEECLISNLHIIK